MTTMEGTAAGFANAKDLIFGPAAHKIQAHLAAPLLLISSQQVRDGGHANQALSVKDAIYLTLNCLDSRRYNWKDE